MLLRKLLILGVIGGVLLGSGITVNAVADSTPVPTPETSAVTYTIYLPIMISGYNLPNPLATPSTFGAEAINQIQTSLMAPLAAAGGTWTRHTVLEWTAIEPTRTTPPTYLWDKVNGGKETGLAAASANGVNVIATVKFTPLWAQKYPGSICGPVHPNNLDEFAQFMAEAVARYSVPPYNVKYWEIGNEPDIAVYNDGGIPGSIFGCWGDSTKPTTFGGDYYAEMLKVVYPAIKAVDPNAKVVIGGLLVDCDPAHPPTGKDCVPANFLEGILQNGGANYFDYVALHAYAYYAPIPSLAQPSVIDETEAAWAHRGGIVVGKVDFLRSVMARYGVSKPIIIDEAGVNCPDYYKLLCNPPPAKFYEDQADYLVKLFVRNISLNVTSTLWFTLEGPGWRHGGLFYDTPPTLAKPAYKALDFLTSELNNAAYVGTVNTYAGVWGYEFLSPVKRIWVLGVTGNTGYAITLPAGWLHVFDKYGTRVTPNGNQVVVQSPLYVEFAP